MEGGYLQAVLFLMNRAEPIRQSSLLMVLASGLGDSVALISGLQALAAESSTPWSNRVQNLRALLQQGQIMSEALTSVQGLLPEQTLIAVRVGEETGTLRQVLTEEAHRLMSLSGNQTPVRVTVPAMMAWATCVGTVVAALVTFQMVFIVPKLKRIFQDFGVDLPDLTQRLIATSDRFVNHWYLFVLPAATVFVYGSWHLCRAMLIRISTGYTLGSAWFPRLWTPLILRMLSITIAAGRTVESGMHSMLRDFHPGRAQQKLSAARARTSAGYDCWESLKTNGFLKDREVAFLNSASRTNHLDWGLMHLSRSIDRQQSLWSHRILSVLHPLVLLVFGYVVLLVVVAMFLPLAKLINDLS